MIFQAVNIVCMKRFITREMTIFTLVQGVISLKSAIHIGFEGCLTVHLPREKMWNANLMQQGNFIDIFLARHVSGTCTHHQEHYILSCRI